MLDRFGKSIAVGWSERELVWLKAAMSLPRNECKAAFYDISAMTGRSMAAVKYQAYRLTYGTTDRHKNLIRPLHPLRPTGALPGGNEAPQPKAAYRQGNQSGAQV